MSDPPRLVEPETRSLLCRRNQELYADAPKWLPDHSPGSVTDVAILMWRALFFGLTFAPGWSPDLFWSYPCEAFVKSLSRRIEAGTHFKYMKFQFAYIFARGTAQEELPSNIPLLEGEQNGILAGGWIYRTISRMVAQGRRGDRNAVRRLYDLCYGGKNSMPAVSEEFVAGALREHRTLLCDTNTKRDLEGLHRQTTEDAWYKTRVKSAIKIVVDDLYHGVSFKPRVGFPSTSACSVDYCLGAGGISEGGALGLLIHHFNLLESRNSFLESPELCGYSGQEPIYSKLGRMDRWNEFIMRNANHIVEDPDKNVATPIGIKEPGKTRVITKENPFLTLLSQSLQQMMIGPLKANPVFQFVGHPIRFGDLDFLCRSDFRSIVSGDYEASTNHIDPELSEYTWRRIAKTVRLQLGEEDQGFLSDSPFWMSVGSLMLTHHQLRYQVGSGAYETVPQRWGQLMGSPMSFPILNIINYCGTCVALNYVPTNTMTNPIRVNGDDIVFPLRDCDSYDTWVAVMRSCGLRRSLGKNYRSPFFAIMNSELYWRRPDHMEYQGFHNTCISLDLVRKGLDAGKHLNPVWTELGPLAHDLLRGNEDRRDRLIEIFLANHQPSLRWVPKGVNYWIPLELGGVGLPGVPDEQSDYTRIALQKAAALYSDAERRTHRPVPKHFSPLDMSLRKIRSSFPTCPLHTITVDEQHPIPQQFSWSEPEFPRAPLGPSSVYLLDRCLSLKDEEMKGGSSVGRIEPQQIAARSLRVLNAESSVYNTRFHHWWPKFSQLKPMQVRKCLSFREFVTGEDATTLEPERIRTSGLYPLFRGLQIERDMSLPVADWWADSGPSRLDDRDHRLLVSDQEMLKRMGLSDPWCDT